MTLLERILHERRSIIVPLLGALIVNVLAYALVVRPLGIRSASAADRARTAAANVTTAERDFAAAQALVKGKTIAEQELSTFYEKVLPSDFSAARRLTYATLPALARKANVKYQASRSDVEPIKNQRLGILHTSMVLEGNYENVRQFIYELETAPPFVIIDDVTLAQPDPDKPLAVTLELSTYFRTGPNGD
jgi:hypothetical protein